MQKLELNFAWISVLRNHVIKFVENRITFNPSLLKKFMFTLTFRKKVICDGIQA